MSIYFGNDTVNDLYVGLTPVSKGYVGTHLFYDGDNTIIDTTYEKYILNTQFSTLYNTAEKPVKSAILKGNTKIYDNLNNEVDVVNCPKTIFGYYLNVSTGEPVTSSSSYITEYFIECPSVKFKIHGDNRYKRIAFYDENKTFIKGQDWSATSNSEQSVSSIPSNAKYIKISFSVAATDEYTPSNKIYLLDSYGKNLYLTHLESVKMPVLKTIGKNFFVADMIKGNRSGSTGNSYNQKGYAITSDFVPISSNQKISFSLKNTDKYMFSQLFFYDGDKNFISGSTFSTLTTPINAKFMHIAIAKLDLSIEFTEDELNKLKDIIQVEYGDKTSYEPCKTNILTVNEEVELRGIGDTKDDLNLLTGELTQHIGEVVLDGSQDGGYDYASNESIGILTLRLPKIPDIINTGGNILGLLSDKYASATGKKPNNILSYNGRIMITKPISELESFNTVDKIKSFLSQNPITVQYPLATPIIKTVDLSVVDQDGDNTKLSTFDDITHVTLSSEGLIPEAEMEVATKNEEVLSTLSLEMDDISTAQTTLEETSNTQSENIDATMFATTEIYEELL